MATKRARSPFKVDFYAPPLYPTLPSGEPLRSMAKVAHCSAICPSPLWPHKAPILIGPEALRVSDWWISEARQGGAGWGGAKRGGTGPGLVCSGIGIMSRARSHLRSALSLAAVSARGATTEGAARRWLSAWPAPQEPGMEYQVSDPRWG